MLGRALLHTRFATSLHGVVSSQKKLFSTEFKDASGNKSNNHATSATDFDNLFADFSTESNSDNIPSDSDGMNGTDSEAAINQVFAEGFYADNLVVKIAKDRLRNMFGETYMDDNFEDFLNKDSDSEIELTDDFVQEKLIDNAMHNSKRTPTVFSDKFADATDLITLSRGDHFSDVLDPRQPPRLSYQHVRMIKNIDYSPVLARAQEGDQFTAGEIMSMMLMAPDNFSSYLAKTAPSRIPYRYQPPFLTSRTVDTLNDSKKACPLCKPDPTPEKRNRVHYTNVELLIRYLNERGQIVSKKVSGNCSRHQASIRYAVKNARNLGLISSTSNWTVPRSYAYPEHFDATYDQIEAQDELVLMNIAKNMDTFREYTRFSNDNFAKKVENDPVLASEQRMFEATQKARKKTTGKPTKAGKKSASKRK